MKQKSLKEISWDVPESTYREDPSLSYSTISTYERSGFNGLETLYDRKDSPSLTFGSAVDAIITGGQEEFDSRFLVAEFPDMSEKATKIIRELFANNHISYRSFDDIPDAIVLDVINKYEYWNNCKSETKITKLKNEGVSSYYDLLFLSENKTLISSQVYEDILNSVRALKESNSTREYFKDDSPFDDSIEHLYQLKFKTVLDGVPYRCMSDLLIVDYKSKTVQPIDLKTSSHTEWDFFKSFIQWNYQIQARLYWRIIRDVMNKDSYFKDFVLKNYKFIVVNKTTLTPLVWSFPYTKSLGTLSIKTADPNKVVIFKDPEVIGKELYKYLQNKPSVPEGISLTGDNNIVDWIEKGYD